MIMKKTLFAVALLIALASCSYDKGLVKAVVVNTQDVTGDGCGYLLVLEDSALLKPIYLDAAFQHNNLPVKIEYTFSGLKDTCNYGPKVYEMATISKIKRDL